MNPGLYFLASISLNPQVPASAPKMSQLVSEIRQADYRGDQAALERLYSETDPFLTVDHRPALVCYWRGFAVWRRAVNGFNDGMDKNEIVRNLTRAVDDFEKSLSTEPNLVDSKIAEAACLMSLAFQNQADQTKVKDRLARLVDLLKQSELADPGNPRLYWVKGPSLWYTPAKAGGGEDAAFAAYSKGLDFARHQKPLPKDSLEPVWGEPELLMNLAWSYLNKKSPNLTESERCARESLKLVPNWHYVRDILLPQILKAKAAHKGDK